MGWKVRVYFNLYFYEGHPWLGFLGHDDRGIEFPSIELRKAEQTSKEQTNQPRGSGSQRMKATRYFHRGEAETPVALQRQ